MKTTRKANKIHKCSYCGGNIQIGEKYVHEQFRVPEFDIDDKQISISYHGFRHHIRDCFPRLLHFENKKEILKNCNFGFHNPVYDMDPDSYDNTDWCEWCGINLINK